MRLKDMCHADGNQAASHLVEELDGQLPLAGLFAGRHGGGVGDRALPALHLRLDGLHEHSSNIDLLLSDSGLDP